MNGNKLDGFDLFKAIGENRSVFAASMEKVDKAAQSLVLAQFKAAATVPKFRELYEAIGSHYFAVALDELGAADLKKILKKIDPHYAVTASTPLPQLHQRIVELIGENAQPTDKPVATTRAPRAPRQAQVRTPAAWPEAMSPPRRKTA